MTGRRLALGVLLSMSSTSQPLPSGIIRSRRIEIRRRHHDGVHGGGAARGVLDPKADLLEHRGDGDAEVDVVVDHEDGARVDDHERPH